MYLATYYNRHILKNSTGTELSLRELGTWMQQSRKLNNYMILFWQILQVNTKKNIPSFLGLASTGGGINICGFF